MSAYHSSVSPTTLYKINLRKMVKNPNHHIWCNNGTWCLYFNLRDANGERTRVRKSLKTRDLDQARNRRDRMLADLVKASGRIFFS